MHLDEMFTGCDYIFTAVSMVKYWYFNAYYAKALWGNIVYKYISKHIINAQGSLIFVYLNAANISLFLRELMVRMTGGIILKVAMRN